MKKCIIIFLSLSLTTFGFAQNKFVSFDYIQKLQFKNGVPEKDKIKTIAQYGSQYADTLSVKVINNEAFEIRNSFDKKEIEIYLKPSNEAFWIKNDKIFIEQLVFGYFDYSRNMIQIESCEDSLINGFDTRCTRFKIPRAQLTIYSTDSLQTKLLELPFINSNGGFVQKELINELENELIVYYELEDYKLLKLKGQLNNLKVSNISFFNISIPKYKETRKDQKWNRDIDGMKRYSLIE